MNKIKRILYGLIGSSIAFVGAASGEQLQLKWQEGKRYVFSQTVSSEMTMRMGGAEMATKSKMFQQMHHDVAAHEKGSEVKTSFDSMKMSVSMNGQEMMSYDSKEDPEGGGLGAAMKPLLEVEMSTIYDKSGSVVEVTGLDNLVGMEQVGMGKKELEQMARQASSLLPKGEVSPGDTWESKMELPLGQLSRAPATVSYEMKFEGMEEKDGNALARIAISGSVTMELDAPEAPALSLEAKKISGTMLFDVALGQPRETTLEMDLEMGLPEGAPVEEGAPGKLPMSVRSSQKLESVVDAE